MIRQVWVKRGQVDLRQIAEVDIPTLTVRMTSRLFEALLEPAGFVLESESVVADPPALTGVWAVVQYEHSGTVVWPYRTEAEARAEADRRFLPVALLPFGQPSDEIVPSQ